MKVRFNILLAAMGGGAIVAALNLNHLRKRIGRDGFVRLGTLVHALASVTVVLSPYTWLAVVAMAVAGMAWIATANSLTVAAQMALPNWVRARSMSIYQMALMGGGAAGAGLWGYIAGQTTVVTGACGAAAFSAFMLLLTWRSRLGGAEDEDMTPARIQTSAPPPQIEIAPDGARSW